MYIRPAHAELDVPTLQAFVKSFPLGQFTTSIAHPEIDTLQSTHIPFVIDPDATGSTPGVLRGHMARANPQCKAILAAARAVTPTSPSTGTELPDEVLVLFTAPTHSYVTPKFYSTTKPDTGKVVPTWDYAAVQVYGKLKVHYEGAPAASFLQNQVEALTDQREEAAGGPQWKVADAPTNYVELLKKGIIGLEIEIRKIEGRFKLSQEMGDGDWKGVVDGFRALGTQAGDKLADMIEERGKHRFA